MGSQIVIVANGGCMVACGIETHTLSSYNKANMEQELWITDETHMHYTACYAIGFYTKLLKN